MDGLREAELGHYIPNENDRYFHETKAQQNNGIN